MVFLVSNLQILAKNQFGVEKSSKSWCGAPFLLAPAQNGHGTEKICLHYKT